MTDYNVTRPIRILPDLLISRIAAGEMVERPASVVKELLENALDANATRIQIKLERGGIRRIVVIDNGRGISEHELPLAMTRYATSKLHRLEEVQAVQTLGFRGEALAAIASVAQLKLTSRQSGAPYPSTIDAQTREVKPAAGNIGTTVEVNDLYFSVPARLKFLKSETTEFGHCLEVIRRLALAHSEVVFSVSHNGRVIAYWPMGEPAQRITHILGGEFTHVHLPVDERDAEYHLWGVTSLPTVSHSRANQQYIFLNRRWVRDSFITHALQHVLAQQANLSGKVTPPVPLTSPSTTAQEQNPPPASEHPLGTALGQLQGVYIVAQNAKGLVLVDMHAAHERILYEKLKRALAQSPLPAQPLSVPVTFTANPIEIGTVDEYNGTLTALGLDLSVISPTTLAVRTLPALLEEANAQSLARAVLADLHAWGSTRVLAEQQNALLATLACHTSVRANQRLTLED